MRDKLEFSIEHLLGLSMEEIFELEWEIEPDLDIEEVYRDDVERHKITRLYGRATLLEQAQDGSEEAWNKLVNAYLSRVILIAKKYENKGMEMMDLIQEGNYALVDAIRAYNPSYMRIEDFNLYINGRIKKRIEDTLDSKSSIIHKPAYIERNLRAIRNARDRFIAENGREATVEELNDILCLSKSRIERITNNYSLQFLSFDELMDEEGITLKDVLPDEETDSPFTCVCKKELRDAITQVFRTLTPREEKVLTLRFGLIDGEPKTLEEVGREMWLSRERIRQIEAKALRKCRHPSRAKWLRPYIDLY